MPWSSADCRCGCSITFRPGGWKTCAQVRDKIDFIEIDLNDATSLARAVTGVDCIFHQAAIASVPRSIAQPLETHAACATGTLTLLAAARKAGVGRVVYAGSSSAYGDSPKPIKQEIDLPQPISPYAAAKLAGEMYCQAFAAMQAVETVTLRYFNVFGPRQDPNSEYSAVIPKFITTLALGQTPHDFRRRQTIARFRVRRRRCASQPPRRRGEGRKSFRPSV